MEPLNRYDQATVGLWGRAYAWIIGHIDDRPLAEAAIHAVYASLRRQPDTASLFRCYDACTAADLALIRSIMPEGAADELLWKVRDAAFYLRWLQLTGRMP